MKRITKIAVAAGAAISLGLAAAAVQAQPYGMMGGYGAGGGYGPGMMGGYGGGGGYGPGMMGGYGGGGGYGPGMMGGYGPGYGMGPQAMFGGYPNATANGLAALKQELGINAKQEPAWQAFADSQKKQDENRQAWFERMRAARAAGSQQEMLAQQSEFLKQRQAELDAQTTALKNLYAALTPQQKAIADQRFGGYAAQYGRAPGGRVR